MAIVTFTTDFGSNSSDLAVLKGSLMRQVPGVQLVDIAHGVKKFDIVEAAFHLRKVMSHFPPGTIHMVGVRSTATSEHPHRVVGIKGCFVIAADTGVFSLIDDGEPDEIRDLHPIPDEDMKWPTFPELESFVPAVVHLAQGGMLANLGTPADSLVPVKSKMPRVDSNAIIGEVIHVDNYGNAITNISRDMLMEAAGTRPILIHLRSSRMEIRTIHRQYADVPVGERVAVFNHLGLLEIAMNNHQVPGGHGGADSLLGLKRGTAIRISIGEAAPEPGFFS
ncbi:MAG: SAM hydrolase/SAM-dependent halogenase family protein [Flavobacteriales bacterium]